MRWLSCIRLWEAAVHISSQLRLQWHHFGGLTLAWGWGLYTTETGSCYKPVSTGSRLPLAPRAGCWTLNSTPLRMSQWFFQLVLKEMSQRPSRSKLMLYWYRKAPSSPALQFPLSGQQKLQELTFILCSLTVSPFALCFIRDLSHISLPPFLYMRTFEKYIAQGHTAKKSGETGIQF